MIRRTSVAVVVLTFAAVSGAQTERRSPRRVPPPDRPVCSQEAICFSGRVAAGEEFRRRLDSDLVFLLTKRWNIAIAPATADERCPEFAGVVNAPYRAHNALYIDTSYGWTAEDEVAASPREFRFVTNCADYRVESERLAIVLWPYTAQSQAKYEEALSKLGSSPLGSGRLWITEAKITHEHDTPENKSGRIEWMKFTVEIKLPRAARRR